MREPYESVEVSRSESGEVVDAPANGEAFGMRLTDAHGEYSGYLIDWQNNPDAWISSEDNVSLQRKL
jgi:hypothetical protein